MRCSTREKKSRSDYARSEQNPWTAAETPAIVGRRFSAPTLYTGWSCRPVGPYARNGHCKSPMAVQPADVLRLRRSPLCAVQYTRPLRGLRLDGPHVSAWTSVAAIVDRSKNSVSWLGVRQAAAETQPVSTKRPPRRECWKPAASSDRGCPDSQQVWSARPMCRSKAPGLVLQNGGWLACTGRTTEHQGSSQLEWPGTHTRCSFVPWSNVSLRVVKCDATVGHSGTSLIGLSPGVERRDRGWWDWNPTCS